MDLSECIFVWIGYIASGFAVLSLLYAGGRQMYRYLWPGMQSWQLESSYLETNISKSFKGEWNSVHPQKKGDEFGLTIRKKKGHARLIDHIRFMQGKFRYNYPLEWAITLSDEKGIITECDMEKGTGFVELTLDKPRLVSRIAVVIVEPRTSSDVPPADFWAFDEIKIREVRLFGRWWRKEIQL